MDKSLGTGEKAEMIWIILAVGLIFRLISLNQSLWLDEAINVLAAKNYSFLGMITEYAKADFHPPGYFILLWIWGRLFGFSEISVRLPSVILAVLTIFIIYLIGKKLVSRKVGLISATLLAVNPLHIYYSQEARMYCLAAFAVSLNMLLFINLMKDDKGNKGNIGEKVFYILSSLLVLLSDYVAYLIFPAQFIFLILSKKVKIIRDFLIGIVMASLLFIWWWPVFLKQLNVGSIVSSEIPAWKEVVGAFGLKPLALTYVKFIIGKVSFDDPLIYAVIFLPIGLFFLYLIWRGIKYSDKFVKNLMIIWLLAPIIIASLISLLIPVYSYFRLLFVLLSFIILVSLGIHAFGSRFKFILLSVTLLIEIIFSASYLSNPIFQREDWRGLVSFLRTKPNDSKILFESSGSFAPFDYYAGDNLKGVGALKNFPVKDDNDLVDLKVALGDSADVYLINYLVEISDPNYVVQKQLTALRYKQSDIKNFNGVGFVYYFVKNE